MANDDFLEVNGNNWNSREVPFHVLFLSSSFQPVAKVLESSLSLRIRA